MYLCRNLKGGELLWRQPSIPQSTYVPIADQKKCKDRQWAVPCLVTVLENHEMQMAL